MVNPKRIVAQSNLISKLEKMKTEMITLDYPAPGFLTPKTSKYSGFGYIPKSQPYPTNSHGQPLSLLAQINFDEMPHIEHYPSTGILGFYIDCFDENLGYDAYNPTDRSGFKVLYFENTDEPYHNTTEVNALFDQYDDDEQYPISNGEIKLSGTLTPDAFPFNAIEFENYFGMDFESFLYEKFDTASSDVGDYLYQRYAPSRLKIGGYPFFTQEDSRAKSSPYNKLLLQIASDLYDITWQDDVLAHFFISEEDLKNRNFDNVIYDWDIY